MCLRWARLQQKGAPQVRSKGRDIAEIRPYAISDAAEISRDNVYLAKTSIVVLIIRSGEYGREATTMFIDFLARRMKRDTSGGDFAAAGGAHMGAGIL